jgi:uncharacterized protein (TIGR02246 family)
MENAMTGNQRLHSLRWGVAAAVVAMTVALGTFAKPAPRAKNDLEAEVRAVIDDQAAAWNRGDIAAFMESYWKSGETTFVGAGGVLHGWKPVLERYQRMYPTRAAMGTLSFSKLEIRPECPDSAYVIGEFQLQRAADTLSGVFTLELRKFPEGWKITVDHSTPYANQNQENR